MFSAKQMVRAGKFNRAIGQNRGGISSGPCDKTTEQGIHSGPCDITEGHSLPDRFTGGKQKKKVKKKKKGGGV